LSRKNVSFQAKQLINVRQEVLKAESVQWKGEQEGHVLLYKKTVSGFMESKIPA